jgi:hypothetical protein
MVDEIAFASMGEESSKAAKIALAAAAALMGVLVI